jgi:DNA invertase Pin-like site-specific DNA recombinase
VYSENHVKKTERIQAASVHPKPVSKCIHVNSCIYEYDQAASGMATKENPKRIPVAILARVSTDKQANARQIHELRQAAAENGWTVIEVIETTGLSGNAKDADRHDLDRIRDLATHGRIRKVLVHEVSRVARRNSTAHKFLEELEALGVSLYWHAQRIETLLPDGKRNPAASIMFSLLAEMARNERETLVERINSGLARARREGTTLGRPKGSHLKRADFLANHRDVVKQLRAGQSIRNTAKITGKGASTVQRVKEQLNVTPAGH